MLDFDIKVVNVLYSHCVKSVRIRSYSGPYSVRMRENTARITPNTDTFYAVCDTLVYIIKPCIGILYVANICQQKC